MRDATRDGFAIHQRAGILGRPVAAVGAGGEKPGIPVVPQRQCRGQRQALVASAAAGLVRAISPSSPRPHTCTTRVPDSNSSRASRPPVSTASPSMNSGWTTTR